MAQTVVVVWYSGAAHLDLVSRGGVDEQLTRCGGVVLNLADRGALYMSFQGSCEGVVVTEFKRLTKGLVTNYGEGEGLQNGMGGT